MFGCVMHVDAYLTELGNNYLSYVECLSMSMASKVSICYIIIIYIL